MGIHNALEKAGIEHEITGVDIMPQKNYPFKFVQADALTFDDVDFYLQMIRFADELGIRNELEELMKKVLIPFEIRLRD